MVLSSSQLLTTHLAWSGPIELSRRRSKHVVDDSSTPRGVVGKGPQSALPERVRTGGKRSGSRNGCVVCVSCGRGVGSVRSAHGSHSTSPEVRLLLEFAQSTFAPPYTLNHRDRGTPHRSLHRPSTEASYDDHDADEWSHYHHQVTHVEELVEKAIHDQVSLRRLAFPRFPSRTALVCILRVCVCVCVISPTRS